MGSICIVILLRMTAEQAEDLYILGDQCPPELIDKIRKHIKANFNADSFEMCPEAQYEIFKSAMVKAIESTPKEKAS